MLYRDGSPVSLTPKEVETLVALVERRGQVISKAELMDRLWPGVAVEESNLSQNLYVLRKTLGSREDGLPMIETFRRRGYRFNGEIQPPDEMELLVATHTHTVTETESLEDPLPEIASRSALSRLVAGAFALVLVLAIAYAAINWIRSESSTTDVEKLHVAASVKMTRLTPDIYIGDIELSPDGRYLAFGRNEELKSALFLKDLTSGSVSQIMPPVDGGYGDLAFSPDGTQIYFTRFLKTAPNGTYFRVPLSGGEPVEVARGAVSRLTFSPDGSRIAFLSLGKSEAANLVVANADGSDLRVLSAGDGRTFWYTAWGSNLSWSPDGRGIAVCGGTLVNGKGQHKVLDVSVADGSWRPIQSPEWNYVEDAAWLADRSGLVVLARETEAAPFQVWRVSYPDGVTRRLTNDLIEYDDLTISADSSVLIVRQDLGNMHLWLARLDASDEARQLTFGTAAFDGYYGIDFLPDTRIVYTSPRDGNFDLWVVDPATGKQDQLTRNAGDYNARPFVTPDGRSIVFVSSRGGSRQVWRMDSDGGNPLRLTGADTADSPVLSPDGRSVYFVQSGDNGSCLARVDIGGGEVECLLKTDSNLFPFSFSPDGKLMTLGTYDAASVQPYRLGIVSGENLSPQGTLPDRLFAPFDWTPDSRSVLAVTAEDRANLSAIPINGGKPIRLTSFSTGRIHAFAVSPDHKRVALSRGNPSAEAVRLEGF